MALKEVDYQKKIVDSVRIRGGWANKWGAQYLIGVPDLVVGHTSFGSCFMEVKLQTMSKDRVHKSFELHKDTLPTAIQERTCTKMWEAGMAVVVAQVLVFGTTVKDSYLILSPINEVNNTWPPTSKHFPVLQWQGGTGYEVVDALAAGLAHGRGAVAR